MWVFIAELDLKISNSCCTVRWQWCFSIIPSQANNSKPRLFSNYAKMPFTVYTVFWALQAEKLLSSLPNNVFCFMEGKIPFGADKFFLLPQSEGHLCEWACLYGTFCASGFSMAAQAGASSDWLSMPSSDSHSFWLDGDYRHALCLVSLLKQAGKGSTQRQCI